MPDRLPVAVESGQRRREVKLCVRRIPVELDGPAEQALRIVEPALLQPDETQTINRTEMAAIRPQDAFIENSSFRQPPAAMERERLLEGARRSSSLRIRKQWRSRIHAA